MDPQNAHTIQDLSNAAADQNQTPPPVPASYVKGESGFSIAPEAPTAESYTPPETVPYTPEVQKPVEIEPTPETQETFVPLAAVSNTPKQEEPLPVVTAKPTEEKPNVVDKTSAATNLHHLQHPHDKITDLADRKEEEFIEDVTAAHHHDDAI